MRIDDAAISDVGLVATGAFADFGIEAGIRLVHVPIIERMAVSLVITSQHDIVLAEPPRVCLVGPFSAPDVPGWRIAAGASRTSPRQCWRSCPSTTAAG